MCRASVGEAINPRANLPFITVLSLLVNPVCGCVSFHFIIILVHWCNTLIPQIHSFFVIYKTHDHHLLLAPLLLLRVSARRRRSRGALLKTGAFDVQEFIVGTAAASFVG